jgi:hypothetical protein
LAAFLFAQGKRTHGPFFATCCDRKRSGGPFAPSGGDNCAVVINALWTRNEYTFARRFLLFKDKSLRRFLTHKNIVEKTEKLAQKGLKKGRLIV